MRLRFILILSMLSLLGCGRSQSGEKTPPTDTEVEDAIREPSWALGSADGDATAEITEGRIIRRGKICRWWVLSRLPRPGPGERDGLPQIIGCQGGERNERLAPWGQFV